MKKNKFVIVGSGSSYAPAIVAVLLQRRTDIRLGEIVLYDIDAARTSCLCRFALAVTRSAKRMKRFPSLMAF